MPFKLVCKIVPICSGIKISVSPVFLPATHANYHGLHSFSGTQFTIDFPITIQIRWKLHLNVIQLLMIISQQNFVHATTVQLPCHVQNFVTVISLESGWEQINFPSHLNCDGNIGPRTCLHRCLHGKAASGCRSMYSWAPSQYKGRLSRI